MLCLGEPTPALLKLSLVLPYPKSAQAFDVFRCIKAVAAGGPPGYWQCSEPFAESQPTRGHVEYFGCLADCECLPRFQHAGSIGVVS